MRYCAAFSAQQMNSSNGIISGLKRSGGMRRQMRQRQKQKEEQRQEAKARTGAETRAEREAGAGAALCSVRRVKEQRQRRRLSL